MRRHRQLQASGFTVAEICISLLILALIVAASVPLISRYRGRTGVNRGIEICKALIERGIQEAKTAGTPLPASIDSGLASPGAPNSPPESAVVVRVRKRIRPSTTPILVTEKSLSTTVNSRVSFFQLAQVDIDADQSLTGVYVEFLAKPETGPSQLLATLPVDVNGDLALVTTAATAAISLEYNDYRRTLELSASGNVVLDRR